MRTHPFSWTIISVTTTTMASSIRTFSSSPDQKKPKQNLNAPHSPRERNLNFFKNRQVAENNQNTFEDTMDQLKAKPIDRSWQKRCANSKEAK